MRLLYCIPNLAGGGAERQMVYLVECARRAGHDVCVATNGSGSNFVLLQKAGVRIALLNVRGNYSPALLVKLNAVIDEFRPQIIHTWLLQMDLVGGFLAILRGKPWVLSERSSENAYRASLRYRVRSMVGRYATVHVANSKEGQHYWREIVGVKATRVIANGLQLKKISLAVALPIKKSEGPRRPIILGVGRLSREKNWPAVLRIAAVLRLNREFELVICGDGPDRGNLGQLVDQLGLGDITKFTGFLPDPYAWMKSASAFVSLSHFEGRPNAVLEAMACGCPVILSDIPSHVEIGGGGRSCLVPIASSFELVARVLDETLAAGSEVRIRVARAKKFAENFSVDAMYTQYEAVYQTILPSVNII